MLECACQCCHRRIRFKPSEAGHLAACPFCLKQTLLQVDSVPRQRANLPQWVLPTAAFAAITIIVSVLVYRFGFYAALSTLNGTPFLFLWIYIVFAVGCWVLGVAFLIYVFNWLREARVLLRQIEANTRAPRVPLPSPPEHKSESAWPSPPKPLIPPEDSKYLPKS